MADQATPYKAGPGDRTTPDDRITPNEANAMREVIAKHFKDIDESEDVFNQTGELEPSWQTCSKIDYSAGCLEETNSLVCADPRVPLGLKGGPWGACGLNGLKRALAHFKSCWAADSLNGLKRSNDSAASPRP